MIRVLVMIAVAGFVLSVVTLSAAVAIGGPQALSHAAWTWGANRNWDFHDRDWDSGWDRHDRFASDDSPQASRELAWTGGDRLDVEVPAEIRYTQAPGPAKLTITGPQRALDDIEIVDGHLKFDHGRHRSYDRKITIVMSAPNITRFDLHGSSSLAIENYRQDRLTIDLSGNADVTAKGEVDVLVLDISGSAEADLGGLKTKGAEIDIAGSGEATIAPTDWAKVEISGSGDVTLLTDPPKLETDVSGSGSIRRGRSDDTAAAPSGAESPPPAVKGGKKL